MSAEATHLTFAEVLADSRVMATRQLRKTLRKPVYVIFAFVQPVMFVLLFRYVFGGAINTGDVDYVDFLMPGIIVQTAVFGALMTGIGLNTDVATGVVDRFRLAADLALGGAVRPHGGRHRAERDDADRDAAGRRRGRVPAERARLDIALALLVVLAFSYTFSWISAFVGLSVKDPETAQSAGFIWVFPLTFVSSAFVPADSMPGWLEAFANINPITLVVDTVRALMIGEGDVAGPLLGTIAWLVGPTGRIRAAVRARLPARVSRRSRPARSSMSAALTSRWVTARRRSPTGPMRTPRRSSAAAKPSHGARK